MAIFAVPTFVLSSHGKTEFSIQKFTSFSECKGTKYTWEYRRLCQLIAGRSHLLTFNCESRWQHVFFTNMSYTSSISMTPRFTGSSYFCMFPMLNPWLTTRRCYTASSSFAIFIYDYLILQPKENLMSCCRGGTVLVHPPILNVW